MKGFAPSFIAVNKTDQQRRASHARMKPLEDGKVLRDETRFKYEILRRVSGNGQFWRQDQFRAGGSEALVSTDDPLKIAAQIPDCRVNLSKTDLHAALRRLCATQLAAILFSSLAVFPRARRNPREGGSSAVNAQPSDFPKTNSRSG